MYAADYDSSASVECPTCHATINSRQPHDLLASDPADPAHDPAVLNRFAWYHTTFRDPWPPLAHEHALHLGTYESALLNMMRTVRHQNHGADQFYLHRVRITSDAKRISPTVIADPGAAYSGHVAMGLVRGPDGKFAIQRYINACEHIGAISLAIEVSAIVETQHIAIPLPTTSDPTVLEALRAYISADDQIPANSRMPTLREVLEAKKSGTCQQLEDRRARAITANAPVRAAEDRYHRVRRQRYLPGLPDDVVDAVEIAASQLPAANAFDDERNYREFSNLVTNASIVTETVTRAPIHSL